MINTLISERHGYYFLYISVHYEISLKRNSHPGSSGLDEKQRDVQAQMEVMKEEATQERNTNHVRHEIHGDDAVIRKCIFKRYLEPI